MKASLKFREDQKKPLFRAKVPLNILGLPFQSGLVAGDSKELCLSLGTFFDSGPGLRIAYRPNDPSKPFSLVLKTGIGSFGSPIDAPMTMCAEFNLLGGIGDTRSNPSFFLHFKPQFGDFSVRKSQSSSSLAYRALSTADSKRGAGDVSSEDEASVESPVVVNRDYLAGISALNGPKLTASASRSSSLVAAAIENALSGMELGARTLLPIRNGAVLNLRWGVRFPEDCKSVFTASRDGGGMGLGSPMAGIWPRGIPLLVMNKIGIDHVPREEGKKDRGKVVGPGGSAYLDDTCFTVRRQLEVLQAESGRMRQALEDLKAEFANSSRRVISGSTPANHTGKFQGAVDRRNGGEKKPEKGGAMGEGEGDSVSDELKKALMCAQQASV